MKKIFFISILVLLCFSSLCQGQIVVPRGYENQDSIRFGLFEAEKFSSYLDSLIDSLG